MKQEEPTGKRLRSAVQAGILYCHNRRKANQRYLLHVVYARMQLTVP